MDQVLKPLRDPAVMLDQAALPWFAELNRSLTDRLDDDAAFRERIRGSTRQMRALAAEIGARAGAGGADAAPLHRVIAGGERFATMSDSSSPMLFAGNGHGQPEPHEETEDQPNSRAERSDSLGSHREGVHT